MIFKHDAAHVRFRSWAFLDDNAGEMLAKIATAKIAQQIKIPTTPPTAGHCR